jgi:hypothetical protein
MNTPSYPHMTAWGLALILAGFLIMIEERPASPVQALAGATLVAVGGLVLAFAKIPAAMGAAALTLVVVCVVHKGSARWRMLGLIALVCGETRANAAPLAKPYRSHHFLISLSGTRPLAQAVKDKFAYSRR